MKGLAWLTADVLERLLGVPLKQLDRIVAARPSLYREDIRDIGGKERRLLVPRTRLRRLQRRLLRTVLDRIEPHPAAYCVKGQGPIKAANRHAGRRWFFHADIENFYPSVRPHRVLKRFLRLGTPADVAELLVGLVTYENQLPQGAPTSTAVGELVLFPLDCRLWSLVTPHGLVYTRYADDITISGGQHLRDRFEPKIVEIIRDEGWTLNDKGGVFGPDERHKMLGLIVNQQPSVDRRYYDKLRWALRLASAGHISLTLEEISSIEGKIEWIRSTNPKRAERLQMMLAVVRGEG